MSYESPLEVICTELTTKIKNQMDENVWQAIQRVGIDVDKDELIRALQYDRDQYQKGYNDGYEDGLNADKWISVEERLPDRQTPVLVYVPPYSDENEEYIGHVAMSYYTRSAQGGYWAGTDGNVYGAIGIIHEPSHRMPLPEPPKEG